jgi:hypothetical protein
MSSAQRAPCSLFLHRGSNSRRHPTCQAARRACTGRRRHRIKGTRFSAPQTKACERLKRPNGGSNSSTRSETNDCHAGGKLRQTYPLHMAAFMNRKARHSVLLSSRVRVWRWMRRWPSLACGRARASWGGCNGEMHDSWCGFCRSDPNLDGTMLFTVEEPSIQSNPNVAQIIPTRCEPIDEEASPASSVALYRPFT